MGVKEIYTVDGYTGTINQLSRIFGKNKETVKQRMRKGWDIASALTRPSRKQKMIVRTKQEEVKVMIFKDELPKIVKKGQVFKIDVGKTDENERIIQTYRVVKKHPHHVQCERIGSLYKQTRGFTYFDVVNAFDVGECYEY